MRPERFELPAFWFVVGKAGNPKALQVSRLQAAPASKSCLSWSTSWYTRAGFMKRVHKPAMKPSPARRFVDCGSRSRHQRHCITATNDKQPEITRGFWSTALSASVRTF